MPRKGYTPEQIIGKLREVDVLVQQGHAVREAVRRIGVSDHTYYVWRREYGGMGVEQAKRLRELERENVRLKRLVADLSLDKDILQGGTSGKLLSPPGRRKLVERVCEQLGVSQRRACQVITQPRGTLRAGI